VNRADAVIVGAGCIGASIAYHLAHHGVKAVVVEREKIPGNGSTGHCAGGVRQQFTTPVNVALSRVSIEAFARMNDELAYEGDIYWPVGYLFCVPDDARWPRFQANVEEQKKLGVPVEVLTPAQVKERWPLLETSDLAGATFCASDGLADPHAVTAAYLAAAKRLGATFEFETELTGVRTAGDRVIAAVTTRGEIATPLVINAAGPYAAEVGAMAGVTMPVVPLRRQIFTTQPLDWLPQNFPMVVDVRTGVYMHKESGGLLLGLADQEEPPSFHTHIDLEFRDKVFMLGFERLPRLEDAEYRAGWGGLYEDTPDHNAILGEAEAVRGFWMANGFSGHGFMHSPAVGMVIADLITGRTPRVDVSALALARFESSALIAEANVI
jgi:sarcosine oxidase subunit beta